MASLLVKDVPPELLWKISTAASMSGKSNKDWVVEILIRATDEAIKYVPLEKMR